MVNSLPRDKILEIYLNEIFLGQNSYGVAAAAQTYFNKTLSELTPQEAALSRRAAEKPVEPPPRSGTATPLCSGATTRFGSCTTTAI